MTQSEQHVPRRMDYADWLLAAIFAAIIVVVSAGVVWRYLLNEPLVWTVELSRILFVWLTFIGAAVAVRDGIHVRVTLLVDLLPPAAQRACYRAGVVLSLAFLGLMIYLGFRWVYLSAGSTTPALKLPENWVVYGALPAGFTLACYYTVRGLMAEFHRSETTASRADEVQL